MKLVTMCGLPRCGSTLLANVLNQHPDITAKLDSPLSHIIGNISEHSTTIHDQTQYTMEELGNLYVSFMRSGLSSWISKICETKIYLDKDRGWARDYDLLFKLVPNTKVICLVRDLRGVISSFDKVDTFKRIVPVPKDEIYNTDNENFNDIDLMEKKLFYYLNLDMVSDNLLSIKELIDCDKYYLKNFKFVTYEDFMEQPRKVLREIYNFIGIDDYDNDLNNITQEPFHDAFFAPYGNHTIKPTLVPEKQTHKYPLIDKRHQLKIINSYSWYYQYFYPKIFAETQRR